MSDLLSINVNSHTEKKGNLTYLSWAWAWAEVLKVDPMATWVVHTYGPQGSEQPCMWIGETAMVHTSVTVKGLRRECMLPVMDHKNNALKSPDARKVSDAIMRCMTKAISMHGLGLYIYAGEDLPEGEEPEKPAPKPTVTRGPVIPVAKGAMDALNDARKNFLLDTADYVKERFEANDIVAAHDSVYEITDDGELLALSTLIPSHIRTAIRKHHESLKVAA